MDTPAPGAPFGADVRRALNLVLQLASQYGLATTNRQYYGWAEYGDGEDIVAALCHLDIVPPGTDWATDPYELTLTDGQLFGRGVVDNKGPAIAVLHALADIAAQKLPTRHRIRLIFGCNEENGSECMHRYAATEQLPVFSFTPDADFALINSEKAIWHLRLRVPLRGFEGVSITGGDRPNVVPASATMHIASGSPLYAFLSEKSLGLVDFHLLRHPDFRLIFVDENVRIDDFCVTKTDDGIAITARGVAAHAMAPNLGQNAIRKLLTLCKACKCADFECDGLVDINDHLANPAATERLEIAQEVPGRGDVTLNLASISMHDNCAEIVLDIRMPDAEMRADILSKITAKMPQGTVIETQYFSPNHYVPADSPLVQTLLGIYHQVTGRQAAPHHTGGGTYARTLPNCCAFGPQYPGEVTNIHNANETYPLEQFQQLREIYRAALLALANLPTGK